MKKERLDELLVQKKFFNSAEAAKRVIMAGLVKVNQEIITQVGTKVAVDAVIEVKNQPHPYVSRGGLKLAKAIHFFGLTLQGKVMMDIGASTGGFTDCALRHHVKLVYAIDVGYGQLAWKLRQDDRVVVMERTNFRYLSPDSFVHGIPNFATVDVSFISLRNIFPKLHQLLAKDGEVVVLIKPQFEAKREQVEKKGIVSDATVHQQVLQQTIQYANHNGFELKGLSFSPIQGNAGNIEFLAHFIHRDTPFQAQANWDKKIAKTVTDAHLTLHKSKRS